MPWAGGQIRLAARNPRRKDLMGIVEWRVSELARLGVDVRYDVVAEGSDVTGLDPDVVIVATGGLPQLPDIDEGAERMVTSWDVLGGDVKPMGEVLFYDDNGTHSALSAAEMIARSGARLEIVTPERMLGIDIGGMNHVPYARAFNETDTRITLNQRVHAVRPERGRLCVELGSDHSPHLSVRHVDWVVTDHGTAATADLYFELKPASSNLGAVDYGALLEGRPQSLTKNPDGRFQLFRIGDAVASRNIHAAVFDALRLVKDL
jgi:NADPH-dependent 2,4-dienoyl-CoA reductase/sulfur reductase-like enzyme